MRRKRYSQIGSRENDFHYVLVDWALKPEKSLGELEAKRISKKEASKPLFLVRE